MCSHTPLNGDTDPIIFKGLKSLTLADSQQQSLLRLALEGISVQKPSIGNLRTLAHSSLPGLQPPHSGRRSARRSGRLASRHCNWYPAKPRARYQNSTSREIRDEFFEYGLNRQPRRVKGGSVRRAKWKWKWKRRGDKTAAKAFATTNGTPAILLQTYISYETLRT